MTVKELIEKLQEYPAKSRVILEGCDCYRIPSGITVDPRWPNDIVISSGDMSMFKD